MSFVFLVLQDFSQEGMLDFARAFSTSNQMIMLLLYFSLSCGRPCYLFTYIEASLKFWDEANFIVVDNLFDVFLDSVYKYLLITFSSFFFIKDINL